MENKNFEIVAVNDLGNIENLAYLLKYDTVYRQFSEEVKVGNGELIVGGKKDGFTGKTRLYCLGKMDVTWPLNLLELLNLLKKRKCI